MPTLILDKEKAKKNIRRMVDKARKAGLEFRPHFKTHQSVTVGEWFREEGVSKIAVSSIEMAKKFALAGWTDITVAISVNAHEIKAINELAERIQLNLLVECKVSVIILEKMLSSNIGLFIKIDTGYGRTGAKWDDTEKIESIISSISQSSTVSFKGFLIHAGHTYKVEGKSLEKVRRIEEILQESLQRAKSLRRNFLNDYPEAIISYGDTPSCSLGNSFDGIDELRPGNFVFYDLVQQSLGACSFDDIAVVLACPVIAVHYDRLEIVLYGGAVHFSKDFVKQDDELIYGRVARHSSLAWDTPVDGAVVRSLSQEHGIVRYKSLDQMRHIGIGDILYVFPVHSCLTADCMGGYLTLSGDVINV